MKHMKTLATLLFFGMVLIGCKEEGNKDETVFAKAETETEIQATTMQDDYASYGAKISATGAMSNTAIAEKYATLKAGDTATVKFEAPINSVCASKGCWMRLDIGKEEEVFVKFKDYAFFVPLDATGEAVVEGKAYLEEVAVAELQHMAQDAGKSKEEISAITAPQRELRFMADGVLIKSK